VIAAVQPAVEVVTASTDWAAIVAAIVTGLAAIIGIVGTSWQANRARRASTADLKTSIDAATANQQASVKAAAENLRASEDAEDRRALRTEKIRVYSEFQGSIDNLLVREGLVSGGGGGGPVAAAYRSAAAVTLIAPADIGTLARYLAREAGKITEAPVTLISDVSSFEGKRENLYDLMRADLGTDQHYTGRGA
jgi:hypothetical protein